MSQLMCPLCEESLDEEGVHFYKHFKYKQYPCGEASCHHEFYAESDRNAHCTKHGHKRSFQKTVNPYIDKLVAMISHDARELTSKSLQTVLDNRFGTDPDISIISPTKSSATEPSTSGSSKKRNFVEEKTPQVVTKKTKSSSSLPQKSSEQTPRRQPKDTPTSSSSRSATKSTAPEVDSTTTDTPSTVSALEKQKRAKKKQRVSELMPAADDSNKTYEEMSAIEKLVGWFDPNVPERRDAAKVQCVQCRMDIIYDYVIRKDHVSKTHMSADIAPEDYEDILKTAMDKSFPELPNSNFACQLCMTCIDIPKSRRREHIEKSHTTSLPPLECPIDGCGKGFRRQCELSGHMKDSHKSDMSRLKNSSFQKIRKHRNVMINTLIDKCFPWTRLEVFEKPILLPNADPSSADRVQNSRFRTMSEQIMAPIGDFSLDSDVRVLERSHNKTRRAPQYNHRDSSSDSSDDEDDQNGTGRTRSKSPTDYTQEIIYIGEKFNSEVAEKLSQRGIVIKREVVDLEEPVMPAPEVDLSVPMDLDTDENVKEEEITAEELKEENQHPSATNIINLTTPPIQQYDTTLATNQFLFTPSSGLLSIPIPAPNSQIERSPLPERFGSASPRQTSSSSARRTSSRWGYRTDSTRPSSRDGYDRYSSSTTTSSSANNNYNNNRNYQSSWNQPSSSYRNPPPSSSSSSFNSYSHSSRPFSRNYDRRRSRSRDRRPNNSSFGSGWRR